MMISDWTKWQSKRRRRLRLLTWCIKAFGVRKRSLSIVPIWSDRISAQSILMSRRRLSRQLKTDCPAPKALDNNYKWILIGPIGINTKADRYVKIIWHLLLHFDIDHIEIEWQREIYCCGEQLLLWGLFPHPHQMKGVCFAVHVTSPEWTFSTRLSCSIGGSKINFIHEDIISHTDEVSHCSMTSCLSNKLFW